MMAIRSAVAMVSSQHVQFVTQREGNEITVGHTMGRSRLPEVTVRGSRDGTTVFIVMEVLLNEN